MNRGKARIIEYIAHQAEVFARAERQTAECRTIAESIVIYKRYAVGYRHLGKLCAGESTLGYLRKCCSGGKCNGFDAASVEYICAELHYTRRKCHGCEFSRICKSILLYHADIASHEGEIHDARIMESIFCDILHICGYRYACKSRIFGECIALYLREALGKNYALEIFSVECITADSAYLSDIQRAQVYILLVSEIFENGCLAVFEYGIFPVARFHRLRNADIIARESVIPVFIEIERKLGAREIQSAVIRSVESIRTDMLYRLGNGKRRKCRAFIESKSSYIYKCIGQIQCRKRRTVSESIVIDICQSCIAEIYRGKILHPLKSVRLYRCERTAVFKYDILYTVASEEEICRNALQFASCGKCHACQLLASLKGILCHRGDICGDTHRLYS